MPRCPGCFVMLTTTNYGGVNVKTCNSCFGTWISRVSLMHIVRAVEPPDAGPDTPSLKDLAALVIEGQNKRPFPCPECRQQMTLDRLHLMIPIDMQFCGKCNYVWLDVGKLAMTQRLYYELTHSVDPKVIEMRDRYALASLGMDMHKQRVPSQTNATPSGMGRGMGFAGVLGTGGGFDLNGLVDMLQS